MNHNKADSRKHSPYVADLVGEYPKQELRLTVGLDRKWYDDEIARRQCEENHGLAYGGVNHNVQGLMGVNEVCVDPGYIRWDLKHNAFLISRARTDIFFFTL